MHCTELLAHYVQVARLESDVTTCRLANLQSKRAQLNMKMYLLTNDSANNFEMQKWLAAKYIEI